MTHPIALARIREIADIIRAHCPDDEQLLLDSLEGETDLYEIAAALNAEDERIDGDIEALSLQIADRGERKARLVKRKDANRAGLIALLEAAGVDKVPLPEATISLRKVPPKIVVTQPDLLPGSCVTLVRKPDMAAIKEQETLPPGCTVDNGGMGVTIRRR